MGYKVHIWTDLVSYLAVAHSESVAHARQLLEDNDLGGNDGSCPERAAARKAIYENNPAIFHGPVAEFAIIGVDGQLRLEDERDELRTKLEALAETYAVSADTAGKRIAALEAELTEARKDSERLRRLYEIADVVSVPYISIRLDLPESAKWDGSTCWWNRGIFNDAIDAVTGAARGGKG